MNPQVMNSVVEKEFNLLKLSGLINPGIV